MGLCKTRPQDRIVEIFCMVGVLGWLGSYQETARSLWIEIFCYAGYDALPGGRSCLFIPLFRGASQFVQ